jgi:hypothetical protein
MDELNLLRDVFISNGYPKNLVDQTIKDSWKTELEKEMKNLQNGQKQEESDQFYNVLHIPYIAGFSEKLSKDLRRVNIGITFQKGNTLQNLLCKLKPPKSIEERKNVIYCIGCNSCSKVYIGETQQSFTSRKYQHQYAVKNKKKDNGIAEHVQTSKHSINWERSIFLDSDEHWRKRKIKESIFIDCLNPGKEISSKSLMNLEKGKEISDIWKEFNSKIRKTFSKNILKLSEQKIQE